MSWLVAGACLLIAIVVLAITAASGTGVFVRSSSLATSSNGWTAVFLADNEVFFGHTKLLNDKEIELSNVFYLQRTSSSSTSSSQTQAPQSLSLVNLTSGQIQCPKDDMVLDRNYVLYYQELNSSSYVVSKLDSLVSKPQTCFNPSAAASPAPSASPSATP